MRIGIVGAGSLGTLFALRLATNGEVRLVGRPGSPRRTVRLEGDRRELDVADDPRAFAGCDAIVVAVKSYDTVAALAPLRGVAPEAIVVSLQNGLVASEGVATALGDHVPLALAPTSEGAMRIVDGAVRHSGAGLTTLGWAAGRNGDDRRLASLRDALERAGFATAIAAPIEPALWAKAIVNAGINPVTALAGVPNGGLAADPALGARARRLASEAAAVARATGIALATDPLAALEATVRATAGNRSSMLQDLDAGRPTEIEAITGAIVAAAARCGVPAPENGRILDEVRAREKA